MTDETVKFDRGVEGEQGTFAAFDMDAFDDGDTVDPFDNVAGNSFDNDAFDDFDSPQIFAETVDEEVVELVAEPFKTDAMEMEKIFAALSEVLEAEGASGKKAKKAKKSKASKAAKASASQGRHAAAEAAPAGAHAASSKKHEPEFSYEEPETDTPKANLAVKSASAGRHLGASEETRAAIKAAAAERAAVKVKKANRKRRTKVGIIAAVAALVVAAIGVYVGGVIYFGSHTMPNTTVDGTDISNMSIEDAQATLDSRAASYKCSVSGNDFYLLLKSGEIDFNLDSEHLVSKIIEESERFTWPLRLKDSRAYGIDGFTSWNQDKLDAILGDYVTTHNAGVTPSQDAFMAFSYESELYEVFPEVIGSAYYPEKVSETVAASLKTMAPHANLSDDQLILPEIYGDDPDLIEKAETCNQYLRASFDIIVDFNDRWSSAGRVLDHIGGTFISQWVHLQDDGSVFFDEAAMKAWCRKYADSHYTFRTKRTYTRPDGQTVTVGGNTGYDSYGWKYDTNAFYTALVNAILTGRTEPLALPGTGRQSAAVWIDDEHPIDFGNTYIDITISTQIVRYIVEGEEVLQAPTVSGDINSDQGTPYGCFYIVYKLHPTHLRGLDPDGTPYDVPVDYWMSFIGNAFGLHDNPNRSVFGWPWAFRDAGSHGCCNLPYAKAKSLYSMTVLGTPVIIHW